MLFTYGSSFFDLCLVDGFCVSHSAAQHKNANVSIVLHHVIVFVVCPSECVF